MAGTASDRNAPKGASGPEAIRKRRRATRSSGAPPMGVSFHQVIRRFEGTGERGEQPWGTV